MKDKIHHYDLLEEMIVSRDKQLALQAKEYERRLEDLNHENERIMEILKQSVPREVFDRERNAMNDKIQILTDFKNSQLGKSELTKWIPWVIAVLFGVLAYYKK